MNVKRIVTSGTVVLFAVAPLGAAHAAFTAYNDCAMTSTGNVTNYQIQNRAATPVYTPSGLLVDYTTGATTSVKCTATASDALTMATVPSVNVLYAAGTDAAAYFNGKLNSTGSPELNFASEYYRYTFSGLSINRTYEFVATMNRNGGGYPDRTSTYTIEGAWLYANASSLGTIISDDRASTTFCTDYNTTNGYVARWTDIMPAVNGTFSVKVMQATPGTKAYGFGMFMLREMDTAVPEPGSVLALCTGLMGLAGFAIRRRSGR